jgi:hypothetical protein
MGRRRSANLGRKKIKYSKRYGSLTRRSGPWILHKADGHVVVLAQSEFTPIGKLDRKDALRMAIDKDIEDGVFDEWAWKRRLGMIKEDAL